MNISNSLTVETKSYSIFCNCKECGKPLFNAFIRDDGYAICQDCRIKHIIKEVVHN